MRLLSLRTIALYVVSVLSVSVATGCAPLIYAYPKIHHFPTTNVNAPQGEVAAFRVKVSHETTPGWCLGYNVKTLTPFRLSRDGQKVGHTEVTLESGAVLLSALSHGWTTAHSVELRLYRPGYEIVTLHPWEKPVKIEWKLASSVAEQERTLDDLLALDSTHPYSQDTLWGSTVGAEAGPPRDVPSEPMEPPNLLARVFGTGPSRAQRRVMLLVATEYMRLASLVESYARDPSGPVTPVVAWESLSGLPDEDRRDTIRRLREKAEWLRTQAE